MKNIIRLCLLFLLCVSLDSCAEEHIHSFSSEWSYDGEYHSKVCVSEGCGVSAAVGAHEWQSNELPDGEACQICVVCGARKDSLKEEEEHICTPSSIVSSNEEGHWYSCNECSGRVGFSEHSWDEGSVFLQPSSEIEGEMLFVCTVCSRSRIEPIDRLPPKMSEEEWRRMFAFDNVRIAESTKNAGVQSETVYSICEGLAESDDGTTVEYLNPSILSHIDFSENYGDFLHYGDGEYRADAVERKSGMITYRFTEIKIKTENGVIDEIEMSMSLGSMIGKIVRVYRFYDYGEVELSVQRLSEDDVLSMLRSDRFSGDFKLEYEYSPLVSDTVSYEIFINSDGYTARRFKNYYLLEVKRGERDAAIEPIREELGLLLARFSPEDFVFSESDAHYYYVGAEDVLTAYIEVQDGRLITLYYAYSDGSSVLVSLTWG